MHRRTLALVAANACLGAAVVVGVTTPADAAPQAAAVTQLTYDDSQAPQYAANTAAAVEVWNTDAPNVHIVKAARGQRANIRIVADPGWPHATLGPVRSNGSVQIWFGKQAVDEGFDKTRIIAHEMGHSLGLPDNRTGKCSDLMSGHSAPTSCTNAHPSPAERATVQRNYARFAASSDAQLTVVINDAA
ncbi:snapalysin family zinc-dependent metalloprotease [Actinokineospora enzanensis]|uniref:snapalysin family zinc-dependent metalloprotease n=1 Tax=Actinokineospora enzanensis TaxID=155975 RepID=UPI0003693205|nr:snapalysin family zinc-dependent metalloprotease [Actinokineospora enzanensis]